MLNVDQSEPFLVESFRRAEMLEGVIALHDETEQRKVWTKAKWSFLAPVEEIRDYFGSEVAFYFAWLNFFTKLLLLPGLAGLALWLLRPEGTSVDTSARIPAFTIFVALWGVSFLALWKREAAGTEWLTEWLTDWLTGWL